MSFVTLKMSASFFKVRSEGILLKVSIVFPIPVPRILWLIFFRKTTNRLWLFRLFCKKVPFQKIMQKRSFNFSNIFKMCIFAD